MTHTPSIGSKHIGRISHNRKPSRFGNNKTLFRSDFNIKHLSGMVHKRKKVSPCWMLWVSPWRQGTTWRTNHWDNSKIHQRFHISVNLFLLHVLIRNQLFFHLQLFLISFPTMSMSELTFSTKNRWWFFFYNNCPTFHHFGGEKLDPGSTTLFWPTEVDVTLLWQSHVSDSSLITILVRDLKRPLPHTCQFCQAAPAGTGWDLVLWG